MAIAPRPTPHQIQDVNWPGFDMPPGIVQEQLDWEHDIERGRTLTLRQLRQDGAQVEVTLRDASLDELRQAAAEAFAGMDQPTPVDPRSLRITEERTFGGAVTLTREDGLTIHFTAAEWMRAADRTAMVDEARERMAREPVHPGYRPPGYRQGGIVAGGGGMWQATPQRPPRRWVNPPRYWVADQEEGEAIPPAVEAVFRYEDGGILPVGVEPREVAGMLTVEQAQAAWEQIMGAYRLSVAGFATEADLQAAEDLLHQLIGDRRYATWKRQRRVWVQSRQDPDMAYDIRPAPRRIQIYRRRRVDGVVGRWRKVRESLCIEAFRAPVADQIATLVVLAEQDEDRLWGTANFFPRFA